MVCVHFMISQTRPLPPLTKNIADNVDYRARVKLAIYGSSVIPRRFVAELFQTDRGYETGDSDYRFWYQDR